LGADIFHFLEFDRTRGDHDSGVVYQAIENAISGYFPDTIRQFSNMLPACNVTDDRMNITIAFSLHPLGIILRTYRCDDTVTALGKGTGSTKAKPSAATRDKNRSCQANLVYSTWQTDYLLFQEYNIPRCAVGLKYAGHSCS